MAAVGLFYVDQQADEMLKKQSDDCELILGHAHLSRHLHFLIGRSETLENHCCNCREDDPIVEVKHCGVTLRMLKSVRDGYDPRVELVENWADLKNLLALLKVPLLRFHAKDG